MIAQLVPRPVFGRVDLLNYAPARVDLTNCVGGDKGPVPVRDGFEVVALDQL